MHPFNFDEKQKKTMKIIEINMISYILIKKHKKCMRNMKSIENYMKSFVIIRNELKSFEII